MFEFYDFSKSIIQSDLFNETSIIKEKQSHLEEVLEYVMLNKVDAWRGGSDISEQGGNYATCKIGAVTWPICMAASGFQYSSDIEAYSDYFHICQQG